MADSLVPQVTRVDLPPLPGVSSIRRDPIGAALDNLQASLRFGVERYNEEHSKVQEENFNYVEDYYKAYELAGIEKNEADVAQDFFAQTGVDINTITKSHVRRVDEGTGRIRGLKFSQKLENAVGTGEIKTVEDFQKAFDAGIADLDREFPDRDSLKVGFMERASQTYERLQAAVFDQDLATREQHSFNVSAQEVMTEFDDWRSAPDPENADPLFVARAQDIKLQFQKKFPNASEERVEQPFLDTLATAAIDPEQADDVDEAADKLLESGVITTSAGRKQVAAFRRQALATAEEALAGPTLAQRQALENAVNAQARKFAKSKKFDDKALEKIVQQYGDFGAARVAQMRQHIEGAFETKDTIPTDLQDDLVFLQENLAAGNVDAIKERASKPEWIASHSTDPDHVAIMDRYNRAAETLEGDSSPWIGEAYRRIEEFGAQHDWSADQVQALRMQYGLAAEENAWEKRSESQKAVEDMLTKGQSAFQAQNPITEAPVDPPKTWVQAHRNVILLATTQREAQTQLDEIAARYERLKKFDTVNVRGMSFARDTSQPAPFPQDDERKLAQAARRELETAKKDARDMEKRLRAARRWEQIRSMELDERGLSDQQLLYQRTYNGDPDAARITETFRN